MVRPLDARLIEGAITKFETALKQQTGDGFAIRAQGDSRNFLLVVEQPGFRVRTPLVSVDDVIANKQWLPQLDEYVVTVVARYIEWKTANAKLEALKAEVKVEEAQGGEHS